MNEFENKECHSLAQKFKLHFEDAIFAKGLIPKKVLLDNTRNIHSYWVFCKYSDGTLISNYWQENSFVDSLKSLLSVQYSELDRPLFFIFNLDNKYKIIEGNEIREEILANPNLDLTDYILCNAYDLIDTLLIIKKQL